MAAATCNITTDKKDVSRPRKHIINSAPLNIQQNIYMYIIREIPYNLQGGPFKLTGSLLHNMQQRTGQFEWSTLYYINYQKSG